MISIVEAVRAAAEMYEPDNAVGVVGLLVIGLPSTISAACAGAALWMTVRRKGQAQIRDERTEAIATKVDEIGAQVINGHPEPMRKDLDTGFDQVIREIRNLDTKLAVERGERRAGQEMLADRLDSIEQHLRRRQ